MNFSKRRLWFLFLCLLAVIYCAVESAGSGDLLIFLSAAMDVDGTTDIYLKTYFDGFHYYYSVLFALLLKPFVFLPYAVLRFSWLLLNLLLYCHLFYLLTTLPAVKMLPDRKKNIFLVCVFLFSFRFLHENLHASQITILIMWLSVAGIINVVKGRQITGALLLAAGISIKLLPVVIIPYLIYRGYIKATFLVLGFYCAMLFLPSLIIGHDYNMFLVKSWWTRVNPTNSQHVVDVDERSFHGISTLLSTLLMEKVPDLHALTLKRNILDVSEHTLFLVLMVTRAAIAALTLFFLRWPPFAKPGSRWQLFTEVSYLLLVIPLIFPHQQHYAFIFSVPAFACVCLYLVMNYNELLSTERIVLLITLVFVYLCGNLRTILGEFNYLYEHYKILTYGALALIPALMWVASRKRVRGLLSA